jgi:hypothetical protein
MQNIRETRKEILKKDWNDYEITDDKKEKKQIVNNTIKVINNTIWINSSLLENKKKDLILCLNDSASFFLKETNSNTKQIYVSEILNHLLSTLKYTQELEYFKMVKKDSFYKKEFLAQIITTTWKILKNKDNTLQKKEEDNIEQNQKGSILTIINSAFEKKWITKIQKSKLIEIFKSKWENEALKTLKEYVN